MNRFEHSRDKTESEARKEAEKMNQAGPNERNPWNQVTTASDVMRDEAEAMAGPLSLIREGDRLIADPEKRLKLYQKVKVLRSSGKLEDDWYFMGMNLQGSAIVRKREMNTGDTLSKTYSPEEIKDLLA